MTQTSFCSWGSFLCMQLALASFQAAPTLAADIEDSASALDAVCPLTDPICREIAELPGNLGPQNETVGPLNRRSARTRDARAQRAGRLRASQSRTPLRTTPGPMTEPHRLSPGTTPGVRIQVHGNETVMSFEGDAVSGQAHHASDTRVVVREAHESRSCFSEHLTLVRQNLGEHAATPLDQTAWDVAWDQTLHCLYPCMTEIDRRELLTCLKDSRAGCMEAAQARAWSEQRYSENFQPLAKTGACAQSATPLPAWGESILSELEQTHTCPRNQTSIRELKAFAKQRIVQGYDATNVPAPGRVRICGYNTKHKQWYNLEGLMLSETEINYQGSRSQAMDCTRNSRPDSSSSIWQQSGADCGGNRSYRSGGRVGDMRLIPLSRNVWIMIYFDPHYKHGESYYHGLVIGSP